MKNKSIKTIFLRNTIICLIFSATFAQAQEASNDAREKNDAVLKEITNHISKNAKFLNLTDAILIQKEAISIFKGSLGVWKKENSYSYLNKKIPQNPETMYIDENDVSFAAKSELFKKIYAISVVNKVPLIVEISKKIFQTKLKSPKCEEPASNAEKCLKIGAGSCGNQATVALALLKLAGLKARPVQFYYNLNGKRYSHIVPEVYIDGDWRLIDSTYGAFWANTQKKDYIQLASTKRILEQKHVRLFWNTALLPYCLNLRPEIPDPFSYLTSQASILRDGKGEIKIDLLKTNGNETFSHLPNFIGDNMPDQLFAGVKFKLQTKKNQKIKIQVVVKDSVFSEQKPLYIVAGNEKQLY